MSAPASDAAWRSSLIAPQVQGLTATPSAGANSGRLADRATKVPGTSPNIRRGYVGSPQQRLCVASGRHAALALRLQSPKTPVNNERTQGVAGFKSTENYIATRDLEVAVNA